MLRRGTPGALEKAAAAYEVLNTWVLIFLIGSLALLAPVLISDWAGKRAAQHLSDKLARGEGTYPDVIVGDASPFPARLIKCSQDFCTVYAARKLRVAPLSTIDWNGALSVKSDKAGG